MKILIKKLQEGTTLAIILELLKDENKRFVNNLKANLNLLHQPNVISDGGYPFAVILRFIDVEVFLNKKLVWGRI